MSKTSQRPIILASSSPYRQQLLRRLHLEFLTEPPEVDESPLDGESPTDTALRLAVLKARAVERNHGQGLVIGSDQVAHADGVRFGKPGGQERALAQLRLLSGKSVRFDTSVCLLDIESGRMHTCVVPTDVVFRELSEAEIQRYVALEQPYNCAGSAKSEGLGISLLAKLSGDDPTALIGLPLIALSDMLRAEGLQLP